MPPLQHTPASSGTTRSLNREIWALAGPAVLTLAAEPIYLLADTAVVSRLGTEALGGLAVASAILLFASGMLIFLTFGTAATVARLIGADDPAEAAEMSVQGLWFSAGLGVLVALVLAVIHPWLLEVFGAEAAVVDAARTYLLVSLWGLPAVTLTMAGAGALRGHLDTRTPLVVSLGANTVNLGLDLLFIFGFGWGIAGSAAGTVVAKWLSAAIFAVVVLRMANRQSVSLRPDPGRIRTMAVVGRDLFIRTVALRAALTLSVGLAAGKGTAALAAYQVAYQFFSFMGYLLDSLEAAAQSLVAKALGASDAILAKITARRILLWAFGLGILLGALSIAGSSTVAGWFSEDAEVISLLSTSLVLVGLIQPFAGLAYALDGILVGAADQRFLALAMLGSLGVLGAGAFAVAPLEDLWPLWILLAVFMGTRVVFLGVRYRGSRWMHMGATM